MWRTPLARALPALLVAGGIALAGCGPSVEQQAADRAAIQQTLEDYLPKLAQAYATGDVEPLREQAVTKEVAIVSARIQEMEQQGREVRPELKSVTIEKVTAWNYSNAFVTTLEVWDLRVFAAGTSTQLSQALAQSNRVKYQLKREQGRWRILFRSIDKTFP